MDSPVLNLINKATLGTPIWGNVFLVGGAVRDSVLGIDSSADLDLVVDGNGDELVDRLWKSGLLESEPVRFPRFGTAMVQIEGHKIEIVSARSETYEAGSRKPIVEKATLRQDAERRDFTCNTLMQRLSDGVILDPLGMALDDLRNRRLRTPSNSDIAFREDPLRLLRAVRFRWQLGFEPVEGLWESVRSNASYLPSISRERIQEEMSKIVVLDDYKNAFDDLNSLGLVEKFWPEFSEPGNSNWSNVTMIPRQLEARLASLLVFTLESEEEDLGLARKLLAELKYSNQVLGKVLVLLKGVWWLRKITDLSKIEARKFLSQFYDERATIFAIAAARLGSLDEISSFSELVNEESNFFAKSDLESPLNGHEIREILGIVEGEDVGRIKGVLRELVINGRLAPRDRDQAKAIVLKEGRNLIRANDVQ